MILIKFIKKGNIEIRLLYDIIIFYDLFKNIYREIMFIIISRTTTLKIDEQYFFTWFTYPLFLFIKRLFLLARWRYNKPRTIFARNKRAKRSCIESEKEWANSFCPKDSGRNRATERFTDRHLANENGANYGTLGYTTGKSRECRDGIID